MRKLLLIVPILLLISGLWAQTAPPATDDAAQMRQEIDQLKKTINSLEQRLDAQEGAAKSATAATPATQPATSQPAASKDETVSDLQSNVRDLNERVNQTERKTLRDRLEWGGDYRYEFHVIRGNIPTHYDGMQLQNLMVNTLWLFTPQSQGGLGMAFNPAMLGQMTPSQFSAFVGQQVQQNYAQYQYFTNNLTFPGLKGAVGQFTPQMQQTLMNYLSQVPGVLQNAYSANSDALMTNRLRLRFDSQVAENVSFGARLSMYKVFGDSTGLQVFDGQPTSMAIDGTTAGVPSGDMVRVERAYFSWNHIGGSNLYLSIGRRPSTGGPPLNYRDDEPRGGTPSGALIDFQFDGITAGYNVNEKMTLRACYGMGYSAGFGNGALLENPADRVKSVHLFGGNMDLYSTDKTFIQATLARAWNVTDGFDGLMVLPNNPLTGAPVTAPVVMRYAPSANLGAINLYGINLQKKLGDFDLFASGNWSSTRPNGLTTPFGGLMSDPFESPVNRDGQMYYLGVRYSVPKDDGRTKLGFEFNHGTKYWFNFAQAADDIIAPKTDTRGDVYETYLTHRISDHFMLKGSYINYNYLWSGSGWQVGAPKRLNSNPILAFPTYDRAKMFTTGLIASF
ncbi:MAG TPA: DUF3373 family protein [Candidatus Sulfotelmatobacter sp.]|nr:DUF3373 family protein [Candidatus Sulfotelmatobacter sp.]